MSIPVKRLRTVLLVAAAVMVSGCALTACGESDETSKSSQASATASTDQPLVNDERLPAPPASLDGADVRAAQQDLLKRLEPVKFEPLGPAYDPADVKRPVWLIKATSTIPFDQVLTAAWIEAAKTAGVPYHVCPGESTTEGNARCLRQAVEQKAGSVIIWSQNLDTIAEPLRQARAAGIKIVDGNNALRIGEDVSPLADAAVSWDLYDNGVALGSYAVAARGADLNALCLHIAEFQVLKASCDGFAESVAKYCKACKVTDKSVPLSELQTQTGALVNQTALENSKLNFVMTSPEGFNPMVIAALKRLGKSPDDVMIGGILGEPAGLELVKKGEYQRVAGGEDPNWMGWAFLDAGARVQAGAIEGTRRGQPTVLATTETWDYPGKISWANWNAAMGIDPSIYRDGFSSLWKSN